MSHHISARPSAHLACIIYDFANLSANSLKFPNRFPYFPFGATFVTFFQFAQRCKERARCLQQTLYSCGRESDSEFVQCCVYIFKYIMFLFSAFFFLLQQAFFVSAAPFSEPDSPGSLILLEPSANSIRFNSTTPE